jgi:hypothetical protein
VRLFVLTHFAVALFQLGDLFLLGVRKLFAGLRGLGAAGLRRDGRRVAELLRGGGQGDRVIDRRAG